MCQLNQKTSLESFTGYKIAFVKDGREGRYYSIAMGTEYVIGKVKVCRKQRRIVETFNNNILESDHTYVEEMVGRTCLYNALSDAKYIYLGHLEEPPIKGKLVILKMTIKGDLLRGSYGHCVVYGGKEITSMEEVTS